MNRTKRYLMTLLMVVAASAAAAAHPLGNFSINQYSRTEIGKSAITIRQVLDMAEIPTFQESTRIDTDKDGNLSHAELEAYFAQFSPEYIANLQLTVNGKPADLRLVSHEIKLEPGAGNLSIMKVYFDLTTDDLANGQINSAEFNNRNYEGRVGWNEMFVKHDSGINVFNSTVFGNAVTDELKAYPQESLSAPLAERSAAFSFTTGTVPAGSKPLLNRDGNTSPAVQKDRLAELIAVPEITPAIVIVGLLLAFGLGAMHAMSPGHGKTVVGAYLVGSHGTPKHAAFLGLTVTITHTLGVFALGVVTLFASNYVLPERLMPMLSFFSGALVLYIGLAMFKKRLLAALGGEPEHQHHHDGHTHSHGGHTHTHLPPADLSWRNLLALGISGGLLPCPSALVLMLAAISLNRVGYGLVLTLVFSFGLAATLTGSGLAFLYIGKIFDRPGLAQNRIVKTLPVFSAFVIACLGAAICYTSL
jgi:ABC-type nickel/cobalt efflux system permease component RcnA